MLIIAKITEPGLLPGVPDACSVKLCSHPAQLVTKGFDERLTTTSASSATAVKSLTEKGLDLIKHDPRLKGHSVFYIVLDNQKGKFEASVFVLDANGMPKGTPDATVRRGTLYGANKVKEINLANMTLTDDSGFALLQDIVEVCRFMMEEIA